MKTEVKEALKLLRYHASKLDLAWMTEQVGIVESAMLEADKDSERLNFLQNSENISSKAMGIEPRAIRQAIDAAMLTK